jgi:sulfur-oxidizing protein SoxX
MLLGGTSTRVMAYADLITCIINPSHKMSSDYLLLSAQTGGVSKMVVFNDVITINKLVNLVKFLEPRYKIKPNIYINYEYYEFELWWGKHAFYC